jgi:transposase
MSGRPLRIDWQEDEQTLYRLYKQEKDHQNRTRLQALWLIRQGRSIKEAAQIVGFHYRTVQEWVAWYRKGGLDEVLRHRHGGHGSPKPWLTSQQEDELKEQASQGEFRTVWEAVDWVKKGFGVEYTYWGMRGVFQRLKLKSKVPRPISPQASEEAQEAWKKGGLLTN